MRDRRPVQSPVERERARVAHEMAGTLPVLAGRGDVAMRVTWDRRFGGLLLGFDGAGQVQVDGDAVLGGADPERVHPLETSGRRRYPTVTGACLHAAGHAGRTRWPWSLPDGPVGAAAAMLECVRVDGLLVAARPRDVLYLRTLLWHVQFPAGGDRWRAAAAALATVGRVDAGVLALRHVNGPLQAALSVALGESDGAALRAVWQTVLALPDGDLVGLLAAADEWCQIVGEVPEGGAPVCGFCGPAPGDRAAVAAEEVDEGWDDPDAQVWAQDEEDAEDERGSPGAAGWPAPLPDDGWGDGWDDGWDDGPDAQEWDDPVVDAATSACMDAATEARAFLAEPDPDAPPAAPGGGVPDDIVLPDDIDIPAGDGASDDAARESAARERRTDREQGAAAAAKRVFDSDGGPRSGGLLGAVRDPTPGERAAAQQLGRALRDAQWRERSVTVRDGAAPPGRFRAREAMLGDAQRSMGATVTARPFRATVRRQVERPPLRVGIMCDCSGSMTTTAQAAASTAWIVAHAVKAVHGTSAAVLFAGTVVPLTRPGRPPARVQLFRTPGASEDFETAAAAVDGVLGLTRSSGARVLVVVSDGQYSARQSRAAEQATARLTAAGVLVLWLNTDPLGGRTRVPRGAMFADITATEALPLVVGAAVAEWLRTR